MTDPDRAARARVEDLLERMARVNLQVVVVARPDATRLAARDRARAAAGAAGRGDLLDEAVTAVRETTMRAFSRSGFSGTWAAQDWGVSVVTADDRVSAAAAFEEAAMAEVVEDLVDEETLDVLRASSGELHRSTGIPSPGSLSSFAASPLLTSETLAQRGIVGVFLILGIVLGFLYGAGVGLLTIAVGVFAAGLRRRTR